jgi:acyl-CoA synthetase (NDP forming)/N-acetylglutamate synthase-like GNAT family acetyltransferase
VSTRAGPGAYALLTDGTTIEIRAARPEDFAAVRELHAKMSPDNLYLRFFSMSPAAAEQEARRICREPSPDHAALLAVLDGEVVGCGAYELAGDGSGPAEVAMTVADDMHNRGIGTLLLEHLISLARRQGVHAFAAETLTEVAVIGAGRRPRSVGRAILRNIITGGFPGPVYAVNPGASELDGVPCVPSAADLPGQVDLAVVAVPAPAVLRVAEDCGRRGIKALAVTTSGLNRTARAELLGICRRYGMRLVGPTSFGVANTAIPLDATFAARHPSPGMAGLALQSTGGTGFVLLEHLSRLGVGISTLISLGDKDDVSGTDMLLWWASDPATKLALFYLESFGNPRKFARTARAVGRATPVLIVNAGRSAPGLRQAAIRAAAAATPQLTRQALFQQAGMIATDNLGELLDATALLASQPVPTGRSIGVVSNTRGGYMLAADACGDAGLQVATLTEDTQRALRDLLPSAATVAGPVDTTAVAGPGAFRRCLELVGADPGLDAVLALTATTAAGDLVPEVAAVRLPVPVAAAFMDQIEAVRLLAGPDGETPAVPAYAYPESAARARGHAARYGAWRATPPGTIPDLDGLHQDRARELVASFLASTPQGGWLPRELTTQLLGCYGVPLADSIAVTTTADAAAAAAAAWSGVPVALKADVPDLVVRRKGAGAFLLDLHGADEVRRGFRSLEDAFGDRLTSVIVQPMITGGVEVTINVLEEQLFGPVVLFGLGGAADVPADRSARLAPLTDAEADDLIRSINAAPLLLGRPGAPGAELGSVKDLLLRVSQMADDLPQITELDLSPVIARRDGALAADARIFLQPAKSTDAYLRRLR